MKLKGHKKGCRCVGCSAETRRRGLARLRARSGTAKKGAGIRKRAMRRVVAAVAKEKGYPPAKNRPRRLHRRARRYCRNAPTSRIVGSNVTVLLTSGQRYALGGQLVTGPGPNCVSISSRLASRVPINSNVRRIEYDNRAKALRAYGKVGRFYHNFKVAVRVSYRSPSGRVVLVSKSPLWRTQ